MRKYAEKLEIAIAAYCLLPNHYHWLVRQDGEQPAGLLPQRVFNSYTKACNLRWGRAGTLFEGPYKAIHVDETGYLLHLCRYIHANPVRHGVVADLGQWAYSNYAEWVGMRHGTLWERTLRDAYFASAQAYDAFVQEYLRDRRHPAGAERYLIE